jgi:hypothetical protein
MKPRAELGVLVLRAWERERPTEWIGSLDVL